MGGITKDTVFVLKNKRYKEADKIVTFFGLNKGKFTALAKGAQRPEVRKTGNLETGSIVKVNLAEGYAFEIITEVETLLTPKNTKLANKLALYVSELLDKYLIEADPNETIFQKAFDFIKSTRQGGDAFYQVNELHLTLLNQAGYLPDFTTCTFTGQTIKDFDQVYLSESGPVAPNYDKVLPTWPLIKSKYFYALANHQAIEEKTNRDFEKNLFKILNFITEKTLDKVLVSKNLFN